MVNLNKKLITDFIFKISQYTQHTNIEKNPSPEKRRDLREVLSIIHQLSQEKVILSNEETGPDRTNNLIIETLNHIDLSLTKLHALTSSGFNTDNIIELISSHAKIYRLLGDREQAIEAYLQALALAKNKNKMESLSHINLKLAKVYADTGDVINAINLLEEAGQFFREGDEKAWELECKNETGSILYRYGKYLQSFQAYENALQMAETLTNCRKVAQIKNRLGVISRILGKKKESELFLKSANDTFKTLNDVAGHVETLNNLAMNYLLNSHYQKALTCLNQSIELCNDLGDLQLMAFINLNKAIFYLQVEDSRNATKFCTDAVKYMWLSNTPLGIAKASRIYGNVFKNYHQFKLASSFYEESIRLYNEFNIPLGEANCCLEYANMLVDVSERNKATTYFNIARDIFNRLEFLDYVHRLDEHLNIMLLNPKQEVIFQPIMNG